MIRPGLLHLAAVLGCAAAPRPAPTAPEPDYARPLPPGSAALRKIEDPARWPDLRAAFADRGPDLLAALDRAIPWFLAPSTLQWFPLEGVSHEQAHASVVAARRLLAESGTAEEFEREFRRLFDAYESVGWDGRGTVFFTGYFAPVFPASRVRTERFRYPVYRRPDDLVTDPKTGAPQGRKSPDGSIRPYPTRAEIQGSDLLAGLELAWLEDSLSAYLVHVNGSARLDLTDGSVLYIGYAGKTDRPYTSLGKSMVEEGILRSRDLNLSAIRREYARDPARVERLMLRNESFVFFREADGTNWPAGSLGYPVTAERSLATDKKIFPRGGLVYVDTKSVRRGSATRDYQRFMVDQDTGGAIRAPGRADIYMGTGGAAESLAGTQKAEGRLYYFFVKPEFVAELLGLVPDQEGG